MSSRKKYLPAIRLVTNPELEGRKITAVYFLIKKGVVVYIGRTENLRVRIIGHKSTLFKSKWFDSFRFIECSDKSLCQYERRWIRRFNPKENLHKYLNNDKIYANLYE